jgi:ADP-dependent NAD(P)H-hydrate dehydratase / NAD(P)H-hydrate epimerase
MCLIARPQLHAPTPDAHKYSRGMVAVVSGEMRGAALLAAGAAMRIAGYVALVDGGAGGPLALVHKAWEEVEGDDCIGALLIGAGLGRSERSASALAAALACVHPLVLDGDALTLIGDSGKVDFRDQTRAVILTPHEGEFCALFPALSGSKAERASAAAALSGATIILKGSLTVIAGDIAQSAIASPWLASAGTGDVLAGLVAGLLSTGMTAFEAASAAVWLHGEAARLAGPALIADDLLTHLPKAIKGCL